MTAETRRVPSEGRNVRQCFAGTSVTAGKGIPHAQCNLTGSPVRFVTIFTPGRIEGMFRAIASKAVVDVISFARSYGARIVGPALHPGLNNYFAPRLTKN